MIENNPLFKGLILVADDDVSFADAFSQMLRIRGYQAIIANSYDATLKALSKNDLDLVTLDLDWANETISGIDILKQIKAKDPSLPVIMITGQASIPTAVEATRLGAFDYLQKNFDREKTFIVIKNAIENGRLKRLKLTDARKRYELIGESSNMNSIRREIAKVGPTDKIILLTGDSGTGKEMVAGQIHYYSSRQEKAFVPVDGGSLVGDLAESLLFGHKKGAFTGAFQDHSGYFEEANGGTLFLDEIQNVSLEIQKKLLRVIDTGEYRYLGENKVRKCNVRLITASNKDLKAMVKDGKFMEDLYYRISVIEIHLPSLRERKEDIPLLAAHFVAGESKEIKGTAQSLSSEAIAALVDYAWPGNVRELRNTIVKMFIKSDNIEISAADVTSAILNDFRHISLKPLEDMVREFRKECAIKALTQTKHNITKAAEILQIDRATLYRLIDECDLREFIRG